MTVPIALTRTKGFNGTRGRSASPIACDESIVSPGRLGAPGSQPAPARPRPMADRPDRYPRDLPGMRESGIGKRDEHDRVALMYGGEGAHGLALGPRLQETDGFGDAALRLAGETRTGRLDGTTALGKTNRRFRVGVGAVPVGGAIPGERAGLKPGKLDGYPCGTRQVGLARTENRQVGARRGEGRAGGSGEAPARVNSLSSRCISRGLNMQSRRSAPPGISNSSSCWPPDPSRQSTGGRNCVGNRRGASRLSATLGPRRRGSRLARIIG